MKLIPKSIRNILFNKNFLPIQKGYIYFQDFLPGNEFDTRITVIGDRAFGFLRKAGPKDFRTSGGDRIIYDKDKIDLRCVQIALRVAEKLKTQSLAFDFLLDQNNEPKICEITYCYQNKAVHNCPGHWDSKLNWHKGHVWPEDAILIDLINEISSKKTHY